MQKPIRICQTEVTEDEEGVPTVDIGFTQENITGRRSMKRVTIRRSKFCPYTEDFVEGFNSGAEKQYEADMKMLKEIREEVKAHRSSNYGVADDILEVIDKYIKEKRK